MSDSGPTDPSAGGDIDRLEVALRIVGDDLEPDRVTRMLGVQPSFSARRGDPIERAAAGATHATGVWIYRLPASPEWELGDAIETLLDRLPADPALWETLVGRFKADVFCGLFLNAANRGAELRPDTLARLVERRLTLGLDIHGADTEG